VSPTVPLRESVLIVAPTNDEWKKLNFALLQRGYGTFTCETALEAYACFEQQKINLILFDEDAIKGRGADLFELMKSQAREQGIMTMPLFMAEAQSRCASDLIDSSNFDRSPSPTVVKAHSNPKPQWVVMPAPSRNKTSLRSRKVANGNGSAWMRRTPVSLIGCSPVMKDLLRTIERISSSDGNVLITGATGTGKELVASAIHNCSERAEQPFIDVNCSAIPESLFEAEFFGHQRGTFTGAHENREGLFEKAGHGTLFLDEVDTLNPAMQAKLLRVLQERQVRRVGGRENIPIHARIIAATNADLKAAVASGKYRADLFFRLRVVPLHVAKLCDRLEDIPLLVDHFLARHEGNADGRNADGRRRQFSTEAMSALMNYSWPGNVRELENVIEYALSISGDYVLGLSDIPADIFETTAENSSPLDDCVGNSAPLADVERQYILAVFEKCGRHHVKTAALLGIDRRTLYRKLLQYNIEISIRGNVVGF
jgi:DNA-binding NtrC family response regulator